MKNIPTVEYLRKEGYKVTVKHRRLFFKYDTFTGKRHEALLSFRDANTSQYRAYFLCATGGDTFVKIESDKFPEPFAAMSKCSPKDNFCKATGRKTAIEKAFKNSNCKNM